MLDVFIIGLALLLIVLGARGTYAQIWNSILPKTPITPGQTTQVQVSGATTFTPPTQQNSGTVIPVAGNPVPVAGNGRIGGVTP